MDSEGLKYNSILVPSVQEMVKEKKPESIPLRYLHTDDEEKVMVEEDSEQKLEIPIIDMNLLTSDESMESELNKLDSACRNWGFFQLINHGVETCFLDKLKAEIHDFFDLPMEEKKKFWQKEGDAEGFGQVFIVSEEQKLNWGDSFYLTSLPRQLRKPHLFPKLPLPFRDTLDAYTVEVENINKTLLAKIGMALKVKPEELNGLFEDELQSLKINYYPPCPQPDRVIGLSPHSDPAGFTVLLQVNETVGLQIRKYGKWVPVKPIPNAFIVNVGDILEIVTNGAYRSIEHRAMVNSEKERISIAMFHNPRMNAEIGPAKSLISEETPVKFTSVTSEDYLKGLFARKLDGKSYLDDLRV